MRTYLESSTRVVAALALIVATAGTASAQAPAAPRSPGQAPPPAAPPAGAAPASSTTATPAEASPPAPGPAAPALGPSAAPPPAAPSPAPAPGDKAAADPMVDRAAKLDKVRFRPGKGLSVESQDGDFSLVVRLRAQFLYTAETEREWQQSFQIRRARLVLGGNAFGKHNKFKTEFAFSPRDESVSNGEGPTMTPLLDWYAEFDYLKNAVFRVGQYKVPFNRQRVISSGDLELVDRALAQGEFNLDRDVGAHLFSPDLGGWGLLRYYAGAWINEGRDAQQLRGFDMMYIGRVEVLPFGLFDDYTEGDLGRRARPGLSVGVAYAYLEKAARDRGILGSVPADEGTTDFHNLTADVMFKWLGFSLLGEVYYRNGTRNPGSAVDENGVLIPAAVPRDGMGWFAQAGYVLPGAPVQLAARYSELRRVGNESESALFGGQEAGGGVSWYPGEHSFKVQADYFHTWTDDPTRADSDRVRVQLQLAY